MRGTDVVLTARRPNPTSLLLIINEAWFNIVNGAPRLAVPATRHARPHADVLPSIVTLSIATTRRSRQSSHPYRHSRFRIPPWESWFHILLISAFYLNGDVSLSPVLDLKKSVCVWELKSRQAKGIRLVVCKALRCI